MVLGGFGRGKCKWGCEEDGDGAVCIVEGTHMYLKEEICSPPLPFAQHTSQSQNVEVRTGPDYYGGGVLILRSFKSF